MIPDATHSSPSNAKSINSTVLRLPSGPVGQIDKTVNTPSPNFQPAKKQQVFEGLAGPAVVKTDGQPPKDIPNLPNDPRYVAAVVGTAEIIGAVTGGRATALKAGAKVADALGIYGDAADALKTVSDIAQKKGTVTIAHDVESDMWDIINTVSPLKGVKGLSSVGLSAVEQKGTEAAENYLSDLIYQTYYKPRN